jgi:hypothetical protein
MRTLQDDTLIEVWNNHGWGVSYLTDRVTRTWQSPGLVKKIPFGELYEAISYKGNRVLFEEGALLIKDNEVRMQLDLPPLDEFSLTLEEMKELLKSGNLEKIENFLQYCSNMALDAFVQVATDLPVTDVTIAKLISKYSNVDILSTIEEKIDRNENSATPDGKPKPRRIVKE